MIILVLPVFTSWLCVLVVLGAPVGMIWWACASELGPDLEREAEDEVFFADLLEQRAEEA